MLCCLSNSRVQSSHANTFESTCIFKTLKWYKAETQVLANISFCLDLTYQAQGASGTYILDDFLNKTQKAWNRTEERIPKYKACLSVR